MMGITGACCRLVGDIVQAMGVARSTSACLEPTPTCKPEDAAQDDDLMIRALTSIFGMESNGKIKKEKARRVVEKLGLMYDDEEAGGEEDEVPVEEVLNGLKDGSDRRHQLLEEAFKIFDEDGNGYIEAVELKRLLQRLGLDKGWDMSQIQKMLMAADLNLDGKIDFSEFEMMMG